MSPGGTTEDFDLSSDLIVAILSSLQDSMTILFASQRLIAGLLSIVPTGTTNRSYGSH